MAVEGKDTGSLLDDFRQAMQKYAAKLSSYETEILQRAERTDQEAMHHPDAELEEDDEDYGGPISAEQMIEERGYLEQDEDNVQEHYETLEERQDDGKLSDSQEERFEQLKDRYDELVERTRDINDRQREVIDESPSLFILSHSDDE